MWKGFVHDRELTIQVHSRNSALCIYSDPADGRPNDYLLMVIPSLA